MPAREVLLQMQHCNDKLSGPHVGKDPNVCSLARKLCPFIGPSMGRRREMSPPRLPLPGFQGCWKLATIHASSAFTWGVTAYETCARASFWLMRTALAAAVLRLQKPWAVTV